MSQDRRPFYASVVDQLTILSCSQVSRTDWEYGYDRRAVSDSETNSLRNEAVCKSEGKISDMLGIKKRLPQDSKTRFQEIVGLLFAGWHHCQRFGSGFFSCSTWFARGKEDALLTKFWQRCEYRIECMHLWGPAKHGLTCQARLLRFIYEKIAWCFQEGPATYCQIKCWHSTPYIWSWHRGKCGGDDQSYSTSEDCARWRSSRAIQALSQQWSSGKPWSSS